MNKQDPPIYVTSPLLPDLEAFGGDLAQIWQNKWLTNHGEFHNRLEAEVADFLGMGQVSLFNNGTISLLVALKALDLPFGSEVITTPFTFAATPHAISWNGLTPVFCDLDPVSMTLAPNKIEALITPNTSAILGVHVYGFPCHVDAIQAIADKHGLKVIYDAAHAFGSALDGVPLGQFGDVSSYSFHATKLFSTMEGGALAYNNPDLKQKIYYLRNFGIQDEDHVVDVGINGKMSEVQAAFGLLTLKQVHAEQAARAKVRAYYERMLDQDQIDIPKVPPSLTHSEQYFVLRFKGSDAKQRREHVYTGLKQEQIFARKYFAPLCSEYGPYKTLASANPEHLPIAYQCADEVLCLPFYGALSDADLDKICRQFNKLLKSSSVCEIS